MKHCASYSCRNDSSQKWQHRQLHNGEGSMCIPIRRSLKLLGEQARASLTFPGELRASMESWFMFLHGSQLFTHNACTKRILPRPRTHRERIKKCNDRLVIYLYGPTRTLAIHNVSVLKSHSCSTLRTFMNWFVDNVQPLAEIKHI